jgi:methionyl-tRNA formyltransferase
VSKLHSAVVAVQGVEAQLQRKLAALKKPIPGLAAETKFKRLETELAGLKNAVNGLATETDSVKTDLMCLATDGVELQTEIIQLHGRPKMSAEVSAPNGALAPPPQSPAAPAPARFE